jgi:hypothetical protein
MFLLIFEDMKAAQKKVVLYNILSLYVKLVTFHPVGNAFIIKQEGWLYCGVLHAFCIFNV